MFTWTKLTWRCNRVWDRVVQHSHTTHTNSLRTFMLHKHGKRRRKSERERECVVQCWITWSTMYGAIANKQKQRRSKDFNQVTCLKLKYKHKHLMIFKMFMHFRLRRSFTHPSLSMTVNHFAWLWNTKPHTVWLHFFPLHFCILDLFVKQPLFEFK